MYIPLHRCNLCRYWPRGSCQQAQHLQYPSHLQGVGPHDVRVWCRSSVTFILFIYDQGNYLLKSLKCDILSRTQHNIHFSLLVRLTSLSFFFFLGKSKSPQLLAANVVVPLWDCCSNSEGAGLFFLRSGRISSSSTSIQYHNTPSISNCPAIETHHQFSLPRDLLQLLLSQSAHPHRQWWVGPDPQKQLALLLQCCGQGLSSSSFSSSCLPTGAEMTDILSDPTHSTIHRLIGRARCTTLYGVRTR